MRGYIFILSALILGDAYGAELARFGPKLCDVGQIRVSGECVDKEQGKCPTGYYLANIDSVTYSAPTIRTRCMNTYNMVGMPDFFHPIYNGVLVKFGPTLCGAGQDLVNGKCERRVQGKCPDNFYKTAIAQNTFAAQTVSDQMCMNTYNSYDLPDWFYVLYNGVLVNFGATLCGPGMRMSDGVCISISQGDCPANYYDITVDEATLQKTNQGACDKGYSSYGLATNCATAAGAPLCAVLCDGDTIYTGMGTCALECADAKAIHTTSGLRIPLYSERQSTPAINIELPSGVCYGNLVQGLVPGMINIDYKNATYHTTD